MANAAIAFAILIWISPGQTATRYPDSLWTFDRRDVHDVDVNVDVNNICVDNNLCGQLTDICANPDKNLVQTLCPEKCGLCPTPAPTTPAPACSKSFCQNSGVCVMVLGKPKCACPDGVSGAHCEHELDPTTQGPPTTTPEPTTPTATNISTTSTTTSPPTTTTKSTTTKSTTTTTTTIGTPISTTPFLCTKDFCLNNGVCVAILGKPRCACPEQITGTHCENLPTTQAATTKPTASLLSACDAEPCQNGGVCKNLPGDMFECTCPRGTTPPLCLLVATTAQSHGHDHHGHTVLPRPTPPGNHHLTPHDHHHVIHTLITDGHHHVTHTDVPRTTVATCDTSPFDGCEKADVVFIISASRYDRSADIHHEFNNLLNMINRLHIEDGSVRVAVVIYHTDVVEVVHLSDFDHDKNGLLNKLNQFNQHQHNIGQPRIDKALEYVMDHTFTNARPNVKKVVYLIIHSASSHDLTSSVTNTVQIANNLKHKCTQIFVSEVLDRVNHYSSTTKQIATMPGAPYYHLYRSFNQLEGAQHNTMLKIQC